MVFIQSERESTDEPRPLRRMVKPAPEVELKRRSTRAVRLGSGILTIRLARWKASEIPKPSIVWYFLLGSTVIFVVDCLGPSWGIARTAIGSAAAAMRPCVRSIVKLVEMVN